MKIAFCAAEAAPFAKVGGLGDVVGSLPKALAQLGDEVVVFLPHYGAIASDDFDIRETSIAFSVTVSNQIYPIRIATCSLPGSTVPIYFIGNDELFTYVPDVYPIDQPQFEALRYDVFAEAILAFLEQQHQKPDIFHLHDWHTSNLAVLLQHQRESRGYFAQAGTVLSLHNMAYQGVLEGRNRLAEGLIWSDALVAVSPTYSQEILTANGGAGLEHLMQDQAHKLTGILNGLDMALFNPETDQFISQQYTAKTASTGKAASKAAVQLEVGLPQTEDVPLFGMVTRLVEQKGLDIFIALLPQLAMLPAQFVILGSGQGNYEAALREANTNTSNIRTMIGFNLALGQHIYAGSDAFLMPSRFEPCGLGQLIALRYGSVPLVRHTGGLADTVFDVTYASDEKKKNGFVFQPYTASALLETVERAIQLWQTDKANWQKLIQNGMTEDFSWTTSAKAYQQVYRRVQSHVKQQTMLV